MTAGEVMMSTKDLGRLVRWAAAAAACALGISLGQGPAEAHQLPQTNLRTIAYTSNLYLWFDVEKKFFEQDLPAASGGRVRIEAMPHDLAGIRGPEVLGLLQNGTLQLASQNLSYMAGDDPRFEGIDLAGFAITTEAVRKATEAYRPVLQRVALEKFNTRLLGIAPLPRQVFWCRIPITGLADLKGKRVRVFNATLSDFMAGVGGTTITMPFVEVVPALQRGLADCAVTGTTSGYSAKWPEVTTHLYPLTVGWAMVFWAANETTWRGLPAPVQAFLAEQYRKLEASAWEAQAKYDAEGVACATTGPCTLGQPGRMTLVPVSAADEAERTRILNATVLPNWARRCGRACVEEWNATVGAALGLRAPVN
jgi:TRAP-type C4-dicarboxylate transport system substrate-binding protein